MKECKRPPIRILDYLPHHPRFDQLRAILESNELRRAEQLQLWAEPKASERAA